MAWQSGRGFSGGWWPWDCGGRDRLIDSKMAGKPREGQDFPFITEADNRMLRNSVSTDKNGSRGAVSISCVGKRYENPISAIAIPINF